MNTRSNATHHATMGSFLREVRSVTVMYDTLPDGTRPDATRLATWLLEYDAAFKSELGVPEGQSLHLLYGRTLNILGPRLLDHIPDVMTIAGTARACGFSVGMQLKVGEVIASPEQLEWLLDDPPMGSVFLDFREVPDQGELDVSALNLLEQLLSAGISLTLLVKPEVLRRMGALESVSVNAANFQIIPPGDNSPAQQPQPTTKRSRKIIPIGSLLEHNSAPFDPCATRMQIFIGPDGFVFPCQGLAGLNEVALCHIGDPFDSGCFTLRLRPLDLARLLALGPDMPATASVRALPVCERHRHQLEAMVAA
jgi:hypothetical protein